MNPSSSPLAAFVIDADGAINSWSHACQQLAGYAPSDVRNRDFRHLIAFDGWSGVAPSITGLADAPATGHLLHADGRHIPVQIVVSDHSGDSSPVQIFIVAVAQNYSRSTPQGQLRDLPIAAVVDHLPCVFYVIDESSRLIFWNRQLEDALEMSVNELRLQEVKNFFDEKDRPMISQQVAEAFERGESTIEAEVVGKHGKRTTFLFHCARSALDGQPCIFGTGLDISARRKTEQGMRVRERAIYSSVNAIVITCGDGTENKIEYVNPAFEHLTGYQLSEIKGRDPRFMRIEECDVHEHKHIHDALQHKQGVRSLLRNRKKNGDIFWNDLRIDPVMNGHGEVTHFVAVINDVTEAKHYERRLQHLAHHDPLTGLANRTLLIERLKFAIEFAARHNVLGALAFLDLDNFKHINDNFGHDAGDAVLCNVAERLSANMRDEDTVARLGGDEFVLLINEPPSHAHVADVLERVRRSVSTPLNIAGQEIIPGTSIGVSIFPKDGGNVDQVMRAADAAMYHAKALGKNNFQFYSEELSQAVHQHLMQQASLSRAISNEELILEYQPKVDLHSGKIVGAEALVRWNHPDDGLTQPSEFIPVAEETGLIVPLGEWVINEACRALKTLSGLGIRDFVIAVNLSARQLRQRQFAQRLGETLAHHGVLPQNFELEVTESQLMDDPADAMDVLVQLKTLGVRLSIDDFGTGYSSLGYLQRFPVDYIKIDRSFMADIGLDSNAVITRAIISLGHNLKLQVVAEGVETREQLAFLREHECDQMQGFYFSRAVSCNRLQGMVCNDVRLCD